MNKRWSVVLSGVALVLVATRMFAEEGPRSVVFRSPSHRAALTGNLETDLFARTYLAFTPRLEQEGDNSLSTRKSPWLAAGLSLVLPGAGEFYAESYWKSALFLALDVAAWGLAIHFDKKGDRQTTFFQSFADEHWSVVKYAQFSLEYFIPTERWNEYAGLIAPGSNPPWQRVNWNLLNRLEREISGTPNGRYYSHTLPPYGDQQYYELIGKYPQYNPGWDDAELPYIYSETNVTPRFKYYAGERGKANDFYRTATTFLTVAIVNHVLSALDAAWSAASYNRSVHASMRLQYIPTEFGYARVPCVQVSVGL
ncbi:MAG: hypothetical protein C4326_11015 [Ignavibacteria bacterium]